MVKHLGMHKTLGVRYIVLFREVPGDTNFCLVAECDSLNPMIQDNLMSAIESSECQQAANLGEALGRKLTTSGENLFMYLHTNGLIRKISVDEVLLTPEPGSRIALREINNIINGKDPNEVPTPTPVVTDSPLVMAKKLLEQAIRLDPSLVGQTIKGADIATILSPPPTLNEVLEGVSDSKRKPGRPKKTQAA